MPIYWLIPVSHGGDQSGPACGVVVCGSVQFTPPEIRFRCNIRTMVDPASSNHCVSVLDPLEQPDFRARHFYCDLSDNKHRVTWQSRMQAAA